MGILATDAFTDANGTTLESHSAGGVTWTKHPAQATAMSIRTNRLRSNASSAVRVLYYSNVVPASADYDVQADWVSVSDNNLSEIGVTGREDTAAETLYYLDARQGGTDGLVIGKHVAGTNTQLGTSAFSPIGNGTLKLEMRGTAIKGYRDGAEVISVTDSAITAKGRPGVRGFDVAGNTVGAHLDNWQVSEPDPPPSGFAHSFVVMVG